MYLQSSIREANSMTKPQLIKALTEARQYLYGGPTWMTKDELVAEWLEVYGVKA